MSRLPAWLKKGCRWLLAGRGRTESGRCRTRPTFKPRVEELEGRLVPSVSPLTYTSYDQATGQLKVIIPNGAATNQHLTIGAYLGSVYVQSEGQDIELVSVQGNPLPAAQVRSLEVVGSDLDNQINLSGVSRAQFANLDCRVTVHGGAGDDSISGSEFEDHLHGNSGNDYIEGGPGNDHVHGDEDSDTLLGMYGDDILSGGPGRDFFRGDFHTEPGQDTVTDWQELPLNSVGEPYEPIVGVENVETNGTDPGCETGTPADPGKPDLVGRFFRYYRKRDKWTTKGVLPLPTNLPFWLQAVIRNIGSAPSSRVTVKFFLSQDTTIDANDFLVGQRSVPSLLPGQEWRLHWNDDPWTVLNKFRLRSYRPRDAQNNLIHGNAYFGMSIDPDGQAAEANYQNNANQGLGIDQAATTLYDPLPRQLHRFAPRTRSALMYRLGARVGGYLEAVDWLLDHGFQPAERAIDGFLQRLLTRVHWSGHFSSLTPRALRIVVRLLPIWGTTHWVQTMDEGQRLSVFDGQVHSGAEYCQSLALSYRSGLKRWQMEFDAGWRPNPHLPLWARYFSWGRYARQWNARFGGLSPGRFE